MGCSMTMHPRIFPSQNQPPSRSLRRYTAAPGPLLAELTARAETRSCDRKTCPPPLQNLHHRLLDESIQHRRDAKFSHPSSVRLRDFYPSDRFRLVNRLPRTNLTSIR